MEVAAQLHLSLEGGVAILIGIGLLVAVWQVLVTQSNERKRSQPIVIAHEDERLGFDPSGDDMIVKAHATNEGVGAAFNVRWGVSYFGVRHAHRLNDEDDYSGNRQRVLHPHNHFPSDGSGIHIRINPVELLAGEGKPEDNTFYWARYENAQGRTWETVNRPERNADLKIRRVWTPRTRERWEARKRRRFLEKGRALERTIPEEAAAVRERAEEEADG